MNAHDRLERQLRESVEMRHAGRAQRRVRRLRPLTALSLAVTLAVVAVVVVALASGSRPAVIAQSPGLRRPPNPGPPSKHVDQTFLASIENSIIGRDRACGIRLPTGKPDRGTPSSEMLSVLPALTRLPPAALPQDHLVQSLGAYTRYVRLARRLDGLGYYLVPVARAGLPATPVPVANRCYAAMLDALQTGIAKLPRSERASTLQYGRAELAVNRYDSETRSTHEGVLLFGLNRGGTGGGGGGSSPSQIETSGQLGWSGGSGGVRRIYGVVPGGVARVRLVFPSRQFTGDVVNDVFVIHLPKGMGRLQSMVWLSPSGQTIRMVDERSSYA